MIDTIHRHANFALHDVMHTGILNDPMRPELFALQHVHCSDRIKLQ